MTVAVDFERVTLREQIFILDRMVMSYYLIDAWGEIAQMELEHERIEAESRLDAAIAEYFSRYEANPFEYNPSISREQQQTRKLRQEILNRVAKLRALAGSTQFPAERESALNMARKLELQVRA
jgi:hypothetical protein